MSELPTSHPPDRKTGWFGTCNITCRERERIMQYEDITRMNVQMKLKRMVSDAVVWILWIGIRQYSRRKCGLGGSLSDARILEALDGNM